jgi:hypothetical protein
VVAAIAVGGTILLIGLLAALIGSKAGEVAQALAGIVGGLLGGAFASYAAYIGVKTTLEGQATIESDKRAAELASIRVALHTEAGMIGLQCLIEFLSWYESLKPPGQIKNPRTATFPPLTIYRSVSNQIGSLTPEECVPLIGFAGALHDVSVVAQDMVSKQGQSVDDRKTMAILLSHACGHVADFLESDRALVPAGSHGLCFSCSRWHLHGRGSARGESASSPWRPKAIAQRSRAKWLRRSRPSL